MVVEMVSRRLLRWICSGDSAVTAPFEIFVERIEPGNECLHYIAQSLKERCTRMFTSSLKSSRNVDPFRSKTRRKIALGFSERIEPSVRLAIIGAGAEISPLLGFARFSVGMAVLLDQANSPEFLADSRTAILIQNHHFGKDFAALHRAFFTTIRLLRIARLAQTAAAIARYAHR